MPFETLGQLACQSKSALRNLAIKFFFNGFAPECLAVKTWGLGSDMINMFPYPGIFGCLESIVGNKSSEPPLILVQQLKIPLSPSELLL